LKELLVMLGKSANRHRSRDEGASMTSVAGELRAQGQGRTTAQKWMALAGWVFVGLGMFAVLWSARAKLTLSPFYVREWGRIGYQLNTLAPMAYLQLACMILYLIPRTSLLGMVLLTGYFGGAIASYVRIGEPFPFPLMTCLFFWAGLYLRDERIRALLPFRR
jgi:hypothetical protein